MRGRKPKPTILKLLSGSHNLRKDRDEPQPEGELHAPPEWMTDTQKTVWTKTINDAPAGLLRCLDDGVLLAYVIAKDGMIEATKAVSRSGVVVKSPTGYPVQSPYESIKNRQSEIMTKNAIELGFSPTSRARVKLDGGKKENRFLAIAERAGRRGSTAR